MCQYTTTPRPTADQASASDHATLFERRPPLGSAQQETAETTPPPFHTVAFDLSSEQAAPMSPLNNDERCRSGGKCAFKSECLVRVSTSYDRYSHVGAASAARQEVP